MTSATLPEGDVRLFVPTFCIASTINSASSVNCLLSSVQAASADVLLPGVRVLELSL